MACVRGLGILAIMEGTLTGIHRNAKMLLCEPLLIFQTIFTARSRPAPR
jgi:hypothetical protein